MDRTAIQSRLDAVYAARAANDADAALACFADDAEVRFAGSPEASAFAASATGRKAIGDLLQVMTGLWQWQAQDVHGTLIDGHSAAVRYTIDTLHVPSGQRVETEIMDHVTFDGDGQIRVFVEFVDTAVAGALLASEALEAS